MDLGQLIYGTCSAAFVALIALMLLRGRISGPGIAILAAQERTTNAARDAVEEAWRGRIDELATGRSHGAEDAPVVHPRT